MGFDTSLSGLNSAAADLDVTSNNIANVATNGFKGSRAEFADVYASDPFNTASTAIGDGVLLADVRQVFSQGNLEFTDSALDMAITGRGFFVLGSDVGGSALSYTRAGAFGVDGNGYIVNSGGGFLQGFPVDSSGNVTATSLNSATSLQVPDSFGTPVSTSNVDIGVNLPSNAPDLPIAAFDPTDASTYTNSTSVTVYDSLGNSHITSVYYIKTDTATNTWESRVFVDGSALTPVGAETMQFDNSGALIVPANGNIAYNAFALANGSAPLTLTLDYSNGTSQFSAAFAVTNVAQDGNTSGRLSSLDITETGVVNTNYTNGATLSIGKIALADFRNPQGLRQVGNTSWTATAQSGAVLAGEAGSGRFGAIEGGALESSNVELTAQLVNLITAQRNFQANAKAIETSNSVTQTIINI
ncbi:MAG: flagellar hook protein FlgE [Gammaproteobacteria bacterium]|nr:flagellar hook protein FlgE [Gammaproteobacteria bacterium]